MKETSGNILFNEIEWENLVEFLRDCPGRICAAVVPGQLAGNALIKRLHSYVKSLPVVVAPHEITPAEMGHLAVKNGVEDQILVIPLDGRRRFETDEERQRFWETMNYQRESFASGKIRTCFILNEENDRWMIHCADDLREWVHVFRFPEAIERSFVAPLLMQSSLSPMLWKKEGASIPLKPLRDQLRRAREAGFSRDQLARDYAGPLFEALVQHEEFAEALRVWKKELHDGADIEHWEPALRFPILFDRVELARKMHNLSAWGRWIHPLLEEAKRTGGKLKEAISHFEHGYYLDSAYNLEGARQAYEDALVIFRAMPFALGLASCLISLGDLRMRMDDLEGARKAYEEALPICRAILDRLGEASCLKSLGDLRMRVDDLEGAQKAYEEALPIFRVIQNRLGEASCHRSLGDLRMRMIDLEGARRANKKALAICRAIQDRQGEANCLRSQGSMELEANRISKAFQRFREALNIYKDIQDAMGQQAALGYLARAAAQSGALDQAILLAEESLALGRRIQDRLGQTITLGLEKELWQGLNEIVALIATVALLQGLYREIHDDTKAQEMEDILQGIMSNAPEEMKKEIQRVLENPEMARAEVVERVRQRFAQTERDLYSPPPEPAPSGAK